MASPSVSLDKKEPWLSDVLVLLIMGVLTLFIGIDQENSWAAREVRHALIAAEMRENGDYLVPRLLDTDYTYKPPALHIPIAGLYNLFGAVTLGIARLPSAIAGLFTAVCLYFLGRRLYGRSTGLWAGAILLVSPGHIQVSRTSRPDMLFTAALVAACMGLVLALRENGIRRLLWFAFAGIAGGMPVLCKGPYGILFSLIWVIGAAILFPTDNREGSRPQWYEWLIFLGFIPVIPLAWGIPAYLHDPTFINSVLHQYNPANEAHARPPYYYLGTIFQYLPPWLLCFWFVMKDVKQSFATVSNESGTLGRLWKWIWTSGAGTGAFLLALGLFTALSAASGKREHYLAPWLPFAVLVLAISIAKRQEVVWLRAVTRTMVILMALGTPLYYTVALSHVPDKWKNINHDRVFTLKAIQIPEKGALMALAEEEEPMYWQNYVVRSFDPKGKIEFIRISEPAEGKLFVWPDAIKKAIAEGRPCYALISNREESAFFKPADSPFTQIKLKYELPEEKKQEPKELRLYQLFPQKK